MSREKSPSLTVDAIIEMEEGIVLIKRGKEPYKGKLAIPGGFVELGETVEEAARREVKEETGLEFKIEELVGVYSEPSRDPRGHVVSVCFKGRAVGGNLNSATDAASVKVFKDIPWNSLAFDHDRILKDANIGG